MVQWLLAKGHSYVHTNDERKTAEDLAAQNGHGEIETLLRCAFCSTG